MDTIRFTEDSVIMAENMEELQTLLESVNGECECIRMGLHINIDETQFIIISKRSTNSEQLTLRVVALSMEWVTTINSGKIQISESIHYLRI